MGTDNAPTQQVTAPPLVPLALTSRLAGTPSGPPRYPVKVRNRSGAEVVAADPRATRALVALMNVHAVVGGASCHWGGPAAFAEINAAIHALMFATSGRPWHDAFHYVNDAGHAENGVYALRANYGFDGLTLEDLKGFRSFTSKLTGHGESHINPKGVLMSSGPLGSLVAQAQGLAMADRTAAHDRVTILVVSDGAAMEGEAKEAFAAIPGLAMRGRVNPFVMVLSDNGTKLSGRIAQNSFSMQPSFEAMDDLGWRVVKVPNGHDFQAVYLAIEQAVVDAKADPTRPVFLWVKTIKGYGIKQTEENSAGGHAFPLANGEKIPFWITELYGGDVPPAELSSWAAALRSDWERKEALEEAKAAAAPASGVPAVKRDKVQAGFAKAAIRAAVDGYPVYSISCDVQGSTGISLFHKTFPERFVEVGIAESNMMSVAVGYSKLGFIPLVDSFGQFGATKGNLPLIMAALSQAPIIALFSHVGFQDAPDGAGHQATTYISALSAIPHTVLIAPSSADEAEALVYQAIRRQAEARRAGRAGESYVFFVGRESYPFTWIEGARYPWGRAQVLREGSDVVLVGSGVLVNKAIEAGILLASQGISATVINHAFLNRPDLQTIGAAVHRSSGRLVTIEDHQTVCGMGALLSHALSREGVAHSVQSLGIPGQFGQSAYFAEQLYQKYELTGPGLVRAALKHVRRSPPPPNCL